MAAVLVCALPLAPRVAEAQVEAEAVGAGRSWAITPSVSVEGTYTDNVSLAANGKSDFITRLSPGIAVAGQSARASASLNYQWQSYKYADNSTLDNQQRTLAAKGKLELVDQWLFVEASHNISQSSVSAFGTQSTGNELVNANRTETAGYSISPYILGRLAGLADYELRFSGSSASSAAGALSGGSASTTRSWIGRLTGATPLALLGWSLSASNQVSRAGSEDSRTSSIAGTLTYQIDPQVRIHVSAGRESDNLTSAVQQKRSTNGQGINWALSERSSIVLKKDISAGAKTFAADFIHRTALTAWTYSDSRSVVVPTPQMALVQTSTAYASAYDAFFRGLVSIEPDAVKRAALVKALLVNVPDTPIYSSLMTSQAYVQRRQQGSVAITGVNNTVLFSIDRSTNERMGTGSGAADDFAANSDVRQSGFNASWTHKLTPDASLTLNASASRSSGSANAETSLKSWALMLSTPLGAKTAATLGLRQSRFNGNTSGSGYDEHAVTGSMSLKF